MNNIEHVDNGVKCEDTLEWRKFLENIEALIFTQSHI